MSQRLRKARSSSSSPPPSFEDHSRSGDMSSIGRRCHRHRAKCRFANARNRALMPCMWITLASFRPARAVSKISGEVRDGHRSPRILNSSIECWYAKTVRFGPGHDEYTALEVMRALKNPFDYRNGDRHHGGCGRHTGIPGRSIRRSEFGSHRSASHARHR